MKRDINEDDFLGKWLSGDLSKEDLKDFEESEDYLAYKDIIKGVERLSRPVFDVEKGLIEQKIYNASYTETKTSKVFKLRTWIYSAAAVVLILIGLRILFFQDNTIATDMAQTQVITLPDHSIVTLNADTSIEYNKKSFMKNRVLHLEGEAFFDVHQGSSFTIHTKNGKITVLGTEFDVYARDQTLEVQCFEGKVRVQKEANEVILTPGKGAKSNKKEGLSIFDVSNPKPDWLDGKSSFFEVPLERLIKEIERQYNIEIRTGDIDSKRIFTGFFEHTNLKVALSTSFDPMNISYTFKSDSVIVLKNK